MTRIVLAANNGDIGGGEVMLLQTARVLRELGHEAHVVGPDVPGGVLDAATAVDLDVTRLAADRRRYLGQLAARRPRRGEWLWCHGLVPALGTTARRRRIVHLHQTPTPRQRPAARVARIGAAVTLVPSRSTAAAVPRAEVLWNWSEPVDRAPTDAPHRDGGRPVRIGFIGRHSTDKGLDVLARAVASLAREQPGGWRLVLAGDDRFVRADQRAGVAAALTEIEALTDRLGWCERGDFFRGVDVAVFPSTWAEPFGLVVTEAMSAGTPVVVSDAGALPEVVGPGHPWVARAGDAADLAAVLSAWAHSSAVDRAAATDRAHERWSEHFSPAAGRRRVAALLEQLGIGGPP